MRTNHEPQPSFSVGRRWSISLNLLLSILAVLALVGMVNYLAARHFQRIPVSTLAQTELSEQTRRILQSVTNMVNVTIYYDRDESLYELVNGLLKEYKFTNPRIAVQTVDYQRDPAGAQLIKSKYKLSAAGEKNLVIFDCNGNRKIIYEKELSDLDLEPLISGRSREVHRSTFKGELLFTSAIYSVTTPRALKAYFLTGHGEHSPESTDGESGFSKFAGILRDNNIDWAVATNNIPNDCSLLIIGGAHYALPPEELQKIEAYLNNGGRALVLFNVFGADHDTGLEKVFADWGVEVGHNVVFDRPNSTSGQDIKVLSFSAHPISAPLINSALHMVYPRTLRRSARGAHKADAPTVSELAFSGTEGTIVDDIRKGVPREPRPGDVRTNAPLAVAVEKGKLPGLGAERGTTRLVAIGDSIIWSNLLLDSAANRDFASLTVNWLLDRSQLLGALAPRPIPQIRVAMTKSQMSAVRWLLLLGMPGSVLLLGAMVWVQRRY
jgi:hypothetical protein